jgi:hypothetical protein
MSDVDVSQDQFQQAVDNDLGSSYLADAADDVAPTEGGSEGRGEGGADTIVNAASKVIELMDNSASINATDYANAIPAGVDAMQLTGWASAPHWISVTWKASSDWWELWNADYDFTVGVSFYYGADHDGHGRYLDYVSPYLDVRYLPPDFSVDVQCVIPDHGMNLGTRADPIAALPLSLTVTLKGFFSQLVSARRTYNAQVVGTGAGTWH